ncbi:DUF7575 domain-containing protein [Natronococcus occultus]|uniref:DUF7575 domain-containing protein n=1 Tax=Natronococcus occultus SP4 TaxID=694430 RepID=L0K2D7_9EURY|nr:hypothetical protein [Natronococcus occultus]AGB38715.1 hypothetical protein Natoc_2960 [Natronococcus occultus SP4]
MSQSTSQKRPWLAALLAALITGLGHLYLRRLRRAVGWLAVSILVTVFLVDQAAFESLAGGSVNTDAILAVWPMYLVVAISVLDAYLIARQPATAHQPAVGDDEDAAPSCPHCGKEHDPELDFCHWCTNPIDDPDPDADSTADAER